MSSDRPFYFFELSGESEVVLWGKILFRTVYRHTWRMDFPPQNEIWIPISPCIFFESGWDTEVVFGCSITDWTVYRHMFRKDWAPKDEIWTRNSPFFFSSQAGIQRLFLDVQSLTGLYTDIRSGRIVHPQTRYGPGTAPLFFRAKRGIRGCFVVKNSVRNCI